MRFFVSTPIGFENLVLEEMKLLWPRLLAKDARPQQDPFPEVQVYKGGLEFDADFFVGLQLNFFLKSANRILLRLASFKARDLPKFYQKLKSLPWREYLSHSHVEWEVSASKSRLNNEKRLQESAEKALQEVFSEGGQQELPCARIFIRMDEDLCTISLDSSGEHLHKRGWSKLKGDAPLRETLAAGLLRVLIADLSPERLKDLRIFDPMMGSGTFLCEARGLLAGHFARPYGFQKWVKAPKLLCSPALAPNYKLSTEHLFKAYEGCDLDPRMVEVTAENFHAVEAQISEFQKNVEVAKFKTSVGDSLQMNFDLQDAIVIVNPPYGERLEEASQKGLPAIFAHLCGRGPERVGVLFPSKERLQRTPAGYKMHLEMPVNNGGIRCLFTVLRRIPRA